jgi:hypothetical protein
MCRNITELRGLEPPATEQEIEAAARQYIRKVSGMTKPLKGLEERFEDAVIEVAAITAALLAELPERRSPTTKLPPLRRIAAREQAAHDHAHEHGHAHEHAAG